MKPPCLPVIGMQRIRYMLFLAAFLAFFLPGAKAQSIASKNKKGNRLFAQGDYAGAEKAYREAQGAAPGNPEIQYNLGNSLIEQRKYDRGVQSLRQSMSTGDRAIKEHSWYNAGNALFMRGEFKDAAEAYVQALKLDPGDWDAKHNLELALMKLKQQNPATGKTNQSGGNKENPTHTDDKNQNGSGSRKDPAESPGQQATQTVQRAGSISREQALQILDALKNRELEDQRKPLERRTIQRSNVRDW